MARCWLFLVTLWLLASPVLAVSDARRAEVEADWLLQAQVREARVAGQAAKPTTAEDAAGGVDGVKDGKWGFHTLPEAKPWWHVDLGASRELARLVIWNRCDATAVRNARLLVLVSDDGQDWRQVYQHDGTTFYGQTDGKPLSVPLRDVRARWLRLQLPGTDYFHLDEVEVFASADPARNIALGRSANQSSVSEWSAKHAPRKPEPELRLDTAGAVARGRRMLADYRELGLDTAALAAGLDQAAANLPADDAPFETRRAAFLRVRWAVRAIALANPRLDCDRLVIVKRRPGSFSHMSDQNYGWWSRPGGGLYVLSGLRGDEPVLRDLTERLPPGSVNSPDLSFDGQKILFAYCRHYPELAGNRDKTKKDSLPEEGFYHLWEVNVDGSGLRRLTTGRYDDFDGRWLPNGEIAFLSTRRGCVTQTTSAATLCTLDKTQPDSYVRCGGDNGRPVAVYTLHAMRPDASGLRALSPFESFEWTPSVAADGRLLYARWDYVDRTNNPFMSLWSTNPDGTNPQAVYGNFTRTPHCIFEARSVPGSHKLMFTGSAHHAITGGSLALFDPAKGLDGPEALTRLTPEVGFPEMEGWPTTFYANPWPLSERSWLCSWSSKPLASQGGQNAGDGAGVYLGDASGNLELVYRDPTISSGYPIPLRPRPVPPVVAGASDPRAEHEGRFLIADVHQGLKGVAPGTIKALRIVMMPLKTQPHMNTPVLGVTVEDPSKCVLGTVPVEADGSAYFRVPSGVGVFFQALDAEGLAVQTMRSLTYVQPKQTLTCIGCHEPRNTAPPNRRLVAAGRAPSRVKPGPPGSWPLRFDALVQPVLEARCVSCHQPAKEAAKWDLTAPKAYETLVGYGKPSLRDNIKARHGQGWSVVNGGPAATSALLELLGAPDGHRGVKLTADERERLVVWMDTYAQRLGSFSGEQEAELTRLRAQWASLLVP
jgi:hypothetical protein